MALTPMQKIAIFFPIDERDRLLAYLQDQGGVQILDLKETPLATELDTPEASTGGDAERVAADIKRAIDDLAEFEEAGGIFGGLGGGKLLVRQDEFVKTVKEFDYRGVLDAVNEIEAERNDLRTRRSHLQSQIEKLLPWSGLDAPLEELLPKGPVRVAAGLIAGGRSAEGLAAQLADATETACLEVVNRSESETYLIVFYHVSEEGGVQDILRRSDFEAQTFEGLTGYPRDLIDAARKEAAEVNSGLERVVEKGREIAHNKPKLMLAYDYFSQEARKSYARGLIGTTRRVGLLEGWIKERDFGALVGDLERHIDDTEVIKISPDEGEEPPIALKNRKPIWPFEILTEMYGMPQAREVDPTPLTAPFFALFFGFCLTDAGYGIVLASLSLILMRYIKGGRKLLWLLFVGGLFTILMGAITGGWFGLTDDTIPSWLGWVGGMRRALMQFDPFDSPMVMFGLALMLGFIQVTFGLIIAMVENFRRRDFMAGIFDQITWIVLLWSLVLYALSRTSVVPAEYTPVFKYGAYAAAIGIVAFSYRASRNPGTRVAWGLYNLYGITGYLGDVLSYTRLLALGLATGGIGMVINVVAGMAKGIPFIGFPAMIAVLIGGHAFNIAVNALGGFVHSARLQYVEFYPKFFEGGGRPFTPFKKELKFTRFVKEEA
jgi:V/A-type H+-transporting ATPase subunit I